LLTPGRCIQAIKIETFNAAVPSASVKPPPANMYAQKYKMYVLNTGTGHHKQFSFLDLKQPGASTFLDVAQTRQAIWSIQILKGVENASCSAIFTCAINPRVDAR
jgi:hypothetical protein